MRVGVLLSLFLLLGMSGSSTVLVSEENPLASRPISEQILETYSAGKYLETTKLMERFRQEDPDGFKSLPYEYLYAKALIRSGQNDRALHAYRVLASTPPLNRTVSLSTARLATLNLPDEALNFYSIALEDRNHPEYATIAREAMEYAWTSKKSDALKKICGQIGTSAGLGRVTQFYSARVLLLQNNPSAARAALLNLISSKKGRRCHESNID